MFSPTLVSKLNASREVVAHFRLNGYVAQCVVFDAVQPEKMCLQLRDVSVAVSVP